MELTEAELELLLIAVGMFRGNAAKPGPEMDALMLRLLKEHAARKDARNAGKYNPLLRIQP